MTETEWALRLSFSVDSQNFIFLRVKDSPILIHCDWQRRGYELVCDCAQPSQLFFLDSPHLTGVLGTQCVQDFPTGQTVGVRGKLARGLSGIPREALSSELSLLRFGKPRPFPRSAMEWICEPHWDPLTQEVALFGLEERVSASVKAISDALSTDRRDSPWSIFGVRRAEKNYKKNLEETIAGQALVFTAP